MHEISFDEMTRPLPRLAPIGELEKYNPWDGRDVPTPDVKFDSVIDNMLKSSSVSGLATAKATPAGATSEHNVNMTLLWDDTTMFDDSEMTNASATCDANVDKLILHELRSLTVMGELHMKKAFEPPEVKVHPSTVQLLIASMVIGEYVETQDSDVEEKVQFDICQLLEPLM